MNKHVENNIEQYVTKYASTQFSNAFSRDLMNRIAEEQKNTIFGINWPELKVVFRRISLPAAIACSLLSISNVVMAEEGTTLFDMLIGLGTLDVVGLTIGGF